MGEAMGSRVDIVGTRFTTIFLLALVVLGVQHAAGADDCETSNTFLLADGHIAAAATTGSAPTVIEMGGPSEYWYQLTDDSWTVTMLQLVFAETSTDGIDIGGGRVILTPPPTGTFEANVAEAIFCLAGPGEAPETTGSIEVLPFTGTQLPYGPATLTALCLIIGGGAIGIVDRSNRAGHG
ncbi:MAG: hypothetical protein P1T08_09065 [Acidimicrobiia bacterium]|nr:hypothetical protein [Acidimicrobiia bacterium]